MGRPKSSSPFKALDDRLRAAQERRDSAKHGRKGPSRDMSGMAVGMRIAVEIVAALGAGVGIGLLLDHWLGTKPWLMILFIFLGAGAAFMNIMRVAKELERKAAQRKEQEAAESSAGHEKG